MRRKDMRCDAHALAESRQTFLFSIYVRLDGTQPQRLVVIPNKPVQRQASTNLTRLCS